MRRRLLLRALSAGALPRAAGGRARLLGISVLVLAAVAVLPGAVARAQDDWEISRDPEPTRRPGGRRPGTRAPTAPPVGAASADERMIERYVSLVLARPEDESAVRRLLERAASRPGGIEGLLAGLTVRREELGARLDLALAAIALARSDEAGARDAVLRAVASLPGEVASHLLLARIELRAGARERAIAALVQASEQAGPRERDAIEREIAGLYLDLGRIADARTVFARLARGGSVLARTELVRALVARGLCAEARADFAEAERAAAADASAAVGIALLRARCERELGDANAARAVLVASMPRATRAGRAAEVLDALVALARETDGLASLSEVLGSLGAVASLHRGVVLEELGRETDALEVFRQVLSRQPRDAETRERVARLLARNGRMEESLDEQRALVRLFPQRVALTLSLATALRDQGHGTEALAVLDRARARARRDRTTLFLLVDAYARLGAEDRVLETLEAIVRAAPDDPRGLVALANELIDRGERDRAISLVERVARTERDGVLGQLEAARALANLRVFDRALVHLEAAARASPDAAEVLDAQAELYGRMGRDDDAERALERRIALAREGGADPAAEQALAEAETRLVASWARRGQLARVRPELEARHAQGDASASRMLADVQRRSGDLAGSLVTLEALAERSPTDARLQTTLARLHHERGDYEAEVATLRRLAELEPARAGWHYTRMVELALAAYRDEDAIGFADEAGRRSIDDAGLFLRLGRLHARRRDPERAAEAYTRALAIDADEFEAAWELATLERERGRGRRAIELYLAILERSRDDELRDRSGRAALETARAEGAEAALEPRLLALALAHGDAPVFRRLALALYASLSGTSLARGDSEALHRWVSRSLPILLASLRDADVGARASARQLLFAHPVPGAAPALVALAADETVEPPVRVEALAAALEVVTPREEAALLGLLEGPSETLAILALHGVMRVQDGRPRAAADRARVLAPLREGEGRLADHAWAWTLLVGGRAVPAEPPGASVEPWLAAWHVAPSSADAAVRLVLARQRALRARDETVLAMAIDLAATGALADAALGELAVRALTASDPAARAARRTLTSRAMLSPDCAPALARSESLEGWLSRALASCPRAPRAVPPSIAALERAAQAIPEAAVVRALSLAAGETSLPEWAPHLAPAVLALSARLAPLRAASPDVALALVRAAAVVPDVLDAAGWSELLSAPSAGVRAASAAAVPVPAMALRLVEVSETDPSWTVRRSALGRLRDRAVSGELRRRAAASGLGDPVSLVRSAALELGAELADAELCALLAGRAEDVDPVVAERTRAVLVRCSPR